ncbi:YdcF family protein [Kitasatospora sp. NPDC057500]|uniref:YdcF family protein n=1 Tax=Kitasatospora sp. NPDC057500 TaxID=3346151 RepID=UPI0036A4031C
MDQLFEAVDRALPHCPPDDGRARLAVQVTVTGGESRPHTSFGLAFGAGDLLGCWWGDSPAARLRLRLPAELLTRFRAHGGSRVTGTSLTMSGAVGFSADWAELAALGDCADGPLFREYVRALDTRPAAPSPDPPTGTGRRAAVVLAAPNDAHGTLGTVARARTRRAVELLATPGTQLVLTGGFGAQFNTTDQPHWRHCAAWLAERPGGPPPVLACLETRHSYDDVLFVDELARHHGIDEVLLVTSDHHAARIRFLASLVRPDLRVVEVTHPDLPEEESTRLRRHDAGALGRTIASTLLFGRDRRLLPLRRVEAGVPHEVWRLDTTAPERTTDSP